MIPSESVWEESALLLTSLAWRVHMTVRLYCLCCQGISTDGIRLDTFAPSSAIFSADRIGRDRSLPYPMFERVYSPPRGVFDVLVAFAGTAGEKPGI